MKKAVLLCVSVLISVTIFSQTDPVMQKIVEIGTSDNRSMEHLDSGEGSSGRMPMKMLHCGPLLNLKNGAWRW